MSDAGISSMRNTVGRTLANMPPIAEIGLTSGLCWMWIDAGKIAMKWRDRITTDPGVLLGKPVIKGTRISVDLILGFLANGWTFEMILGSYPHIARADILAALAFAAEMMRDERCIAGHKAVAR